MKYSLVKDLINIETNKDISHGYLYGSVGVNDEEYIFNNLSSELNLTISECDDEEIKITKELSNKERYHYEDGYFVYSRKLPIYGDIRFSVEKNDLGLIIKYGKNYRRYSEIMLFQHDLPERIASIFSYWSLIERNLLSLHCSAANINDRTVLIFAPPDTGKTQTVMNLVTKSGWKFISDDIAITDGVNLYSVPYTRSGVWEWDNKRRKKRNHPISKRTIKSRVYDYIYDKYNGDIENRTELISKITDVFIIERGVDGLDKLTTKDSLNILYSMNSLEFHNISTKHLWYASSLANFYNMFDLKANELNLLEKTIQSANNIYKLNCENPNDFYARIEEIIKNND